MDKQTEKKVFGRLKKYLALEGQVLHRTYPPSASYHAFGDYYVTEGGVVTASHIDLEVWAEEMRVETGGAK